MVVTVIELQRNTHAESTEESELLRATRFLFRNRAWTKVLLRGARTTLERGATSYIIAVFVHRRSRSLGAYHGPHRISRRHRGLGSFPPRIKGPVLEAVERKEMRNFQNFKRRFFATASRPFPGPSSKRKKKQKRRNVEDHTRACGMGV